MGEGDIRATVTSRTNYSPLLHQSLESGLVSTDGRWCTERGYCFNAAFSGGYYVTLDGDHYNFTPGVGYFGLEKGIFDLEAGLLYGGSPLGGLFFNDARYLGGRLRVGEHWLNGEVYGGRQMFEIWQNGVPTQHWDNWLVGATFAGGTSILQGRVNYEHEITPGGKTDDSRLSFMVNSRPGWDRLLIFSAGKAFLPAEGFDINSGVHIDAVEGMLGIEASYRYSNLPPFFQFAGLDQMPGYQDQRGRLAITATPIDWLSMTVAGEYGEHFAGAEASVTVPYVGASFLYRKDLDLESQAIGGTLYGRIPVIDSLTIRPYATVLHQEGNDISRGGTLFDGGGRVSWSPLDQLVVSANGGYMTTPLTGDNGYVMVTLIGGFGASSGESSPKRSHTLSHSFPSQAPTKFAVARVPRSSGALMKKLVGDFSHKDHFEDNVSEIDDRPLACTDCHSQSPIIDVKPALVSEVCSDCHDEEEFNETFAQLRGVQHPGTTGGQVCTSCHTDISQLESPTGGWGAIIKYPHATEIWEPGRSIWRDHGLKQDPTCTTCHTDTVQYDNHTVSSCSSCHDSLQPNNTTTQSPHNDGWRVGHVVQAKSNVQSCTSCHTNFSSCRSCHTQEGVMSQDIHHNAGFFRRVDGSPSNNLRKGVIASRSGGAVCASCHTPAEFERVENKQENCGRCH